VPITATTALMIACHLAHRSAYFEELYQHRSGNGNLKQFSREKPFSIRKSEVRKDLLLLTRSNDNTQRNSDIRFESEWN
jgi:hypothetical protein